MIYTRSSFYYGFNVTAQPYNGNMNIDEGAGEITIAVPVGSYTLQTLTDAIRNALLTQGTLDYIVTVDRQERKITISADQNFDLLIDSGSNASSSIWQLIGFNVSLDKTGADNYESDYEAGNSYRPQFKLQNYVPPEDHQSRNQSSKNVAADGTTVEVINFGLAKFIEMNIKYISNVAGDGYVIEKNFKALEEVREFLQFITGLAEFEFMPDRDAAGNYFRCIVESMPGFGDGTGYRLKELYDDNIADVYETGVMKFRVIE